MDTGQWLAVIMAAFCIAEVLQVFLLRQAVMQIKQRMDTLVPADKRIGSVLAESAIDFIRIVSENKNGEAEVLVNFTKVLAVEAFDGVKQKIPLLAGPSQMDESMEKLARKNPWVGLALGMAQTFGPIIAEKVQQQQAIQPQGVKKPGTGGRAYG